MNKAKELLRVNTKKIHEIAERSASNPRLILVLSNVSDCTARAAQIFVGALPILAVYPFLQRFLSECPFDE